MSLSVGIIKFPTEWKNKIHVPNHQPVMLSRLFHILLDKWLLYRNSKMTKRKIRKIQFWKTYSSGDSLFGWVSQQLDKAKKKSVNWVQFCLLLENPTRSNKYIDLPESAMLIPSIGIHLTYQVGRHSAKFSLFVWPPRLGATPWASAQRRSISCTQGRKNFQPRGGLGCGASDGKNHPRKIDRKMICKWDHYDFSIETHL